MYLFLKLIIIQYLITISHNIYIITDKKKNINITYITLPQYI